MLIRIMKHPIFRFEIVGNGVSLSTGWLTSMTSLGPAFSVPTVLLADSLPLWTLALRREMKQGRGVF